jgi:hypothetical protein
MSRAFQRHQEHGSEASWFGGSHNYKTKQNKTNFPSFISMLVSRKKRGKKKEASWFGGSHNYKTKTKKFPSFISMLVSGKKREKKKE